jgi:hypothetical protein
MMPFYDEECKIKNNSAIIFSFPLKTLDFKYNFTLLLQRNTKSLTKLQKT